MKEVMYFDNEDYKVWRHNKSEEQLADNSVADSNDITIDIRNEEPQVSSEPSSNATVNEVTISSQQPAPAASNLPVPTASSVPPPMQTPTNPVNQSPQNLVPVNKVVVYHVFTPDVMTSNMIMQRYNIADAGVSIRQAQQLNFNTYINSQKLDYNVQANLETERHLRETKRIEAQFKGNSSYSSSSDCAVTNGKKFNWNDLKLRFIDENAIVKDRVSSKVMIWIREQDTNRHIPISDAELKTLFREFVEDKMGWDFEMSDKEFDRESKKLIRQIPMLSQSSVKKLTETVLAFENGYFDIIAKQFSPIQNEHKVFNKFSMLYDFDPHSPNPDAFDALLDDMFDGDESLMALAYEMIGAMISPVSTLKRIYVFQGVSHGGKTRLSNIILRLIDESDVYSFNTVSDITNEEFVKQSHSCRLVYIKDCSRHKLKDKQISYLKSFADGGRLSNSAVFKILICTRECSHY